MTPEERQSIEARADRALRRGELSEAFRLFQQLKGAFPDDAALQTRIALLQETLQPAELLSPKANFRAEPAGAPQSPMDEAEVRAARGDYAGAIALYRTLLAARPDSELIKERLAELFGLVQAQAPRRAPHQREAVLAELLSRISTRKRSR